MAGTGHAGSSSLWRWKKWISHGSGIGATTSQASDKLLDLRYDSANGCEVGRRQRPCNCDSERDFAIGEGPVLVEHGLEC